MADPQSHDELISEFMTITTATPEQVSLKWSFNSHRLSLLAEEANGIPTLRHNNTSLKIDGI